MHLLWVQSQGLYHPKHSVHCEMADICTHQIALWPSAYVCGLTLLYLCMSVMETHAITIHFRRVGFVCSQAPPTQCVCANDMKRGMITRHCLSMVKAGRWKMCLSRVSHECTKKTPHFSWVYRGKYKIPDTQTMARRWLRYLASDTVATRRIRSRQD